MKKKIKIAHLYYDLMNLYGESGNIKAMVKFIERQGVDVEVNFLTVGDEIDFYAYDIYYMGMGSEANQKLVIEDIMKYKRQIRDAVDDGKVFLATGNAMEVFGKRIREKSGLTIECLDTFAFTATQENNRIVNDVLYTFPDLPEGKGNKVFGFKNAATSIFYNDARMFGFADNIHKNNFFGMLFVGPLLIRNPYFTDYFLKIVFDQKGYEYNVQEDTIEYKAYQEFYTNFITNDPFD